MKQLKGKEAREVLDALIGDDRELRHMVAEEHLNVRVARMIHSARKEAGLTQKQLAELIGSTQSVISQLEDADYEGHSLSMLQRPHVRWSLLRHCRWSHQRLGEGSRSTSSSISSSRSS